MGYKDEIDEILSEIPIDEILYELPSGSRTVAGDYSEYDGGDETKCEHKHVREIMLVVSVVRECMDCGETLK